MIYGHAVSIPTVFEGADGQHSVTLPAIFVASNSPGPNPIANGRMGVSGGPMVCR